ncbi:MAG: hypothetical protein WCS88_01700 [Patescibacteria group bacterium]
MESRQRNILISLGIIVVVVFIFTLIVRYGMHMFFDDFDYFKAF